MTAPDLAHAALPVTTGAEVIGVGVDLVHVPAFARLLDEPGSSLAAAFTPGERLAAEDRGDGPAAHLAARWAAKEAVLKAWSQAVHGEPPLVAEQVHRLVEIVQDAWGRPRVVLHGVVAEAAAGLDLHLSLSHDGDHAIAWVVATTALGLSPAETPRLPGGTRAASA